MLRSLAASARLPAAAARRRLLHLGRGVGSGEEVESVAYRMSMLRAPPVVRKRAITSPNSCSLIGRLDAPVSPYHNSSEEDPNAYTFLSVAPSSSSSSSSSNFKLRLPLIVLTSPIRLRLSVVHSCSALMQNILILIGKNMSPSLPCLIVRFRFGLAFRSCQVYCCSCS